MFGLSSGETQDLASEGGAWLWRWRGGKAEICKLRDMCHVVHIAITIIIIIIVCMATIVGIIVDIIKTIFALIMTAIIIISSSSSKISV